MTNGNHHNDNYPPTLTVITPPLSAEDFLRKYEIPQTSENIEKIKAIRRHGHPEDILTPEQYREYSGLKDNANRIIFLVYEGYSDKEILEMLFHS